MLPILYQTHDLILYSYPLLMGLGWGVAYQIYFSLIPQDISRKYSQAIYWGIFLFAWLGAKILFLATVPELVSEDMVMSASFWLGGGFVFYGGLIGGLLFLILYRSFGLPLNMALLWPILPAMTIGHGIGRIGCFLAGCCYGAITDLPWAVHMHGGLRHPSQLVEAAGLLILGFYFIKARTKDFTLISIYLIGYGVLRIFVEVLRGDEVRGLWGVLTPSQWISIVLIAVGIGILLNPLKSRLFTVTQQK